MKKRIIILVVSLIIVTGIIIGVSYAFFSTGGKQETANTFTSGCLNISLTDASASINLNNIYPITDIEGLDTTSYDFTITNTCNTDANYEINLESLNEVSNSLSADYIKASLSSDTVGNVISILSDNTSVTPEIDGAYEAYNLYTGTLKASETKTYYLKLWLDYDATVEVAANKVYQSKINVIANPEIQVVDNLEAIFELNDKTLTSNLTSNVTSATYCTTTDNICTPNTSANISNNSYIVKLETKEENQMVCTRLNGTSKIICSSKVEGVKLCPEGAEACNTILANTELKTDTPDFSKTSCTNGSNDGGNCGEETVGIYEETTSKGKTYYYRGDVENNYLVFADKYWRIIRINEDGTVRIIYSGEKSEVDAAGKETVLANGYNDSNTQYTQIQTSAFNSSYNASYYVGYTYQTNAQRPSSQNGGTPSTIKGILDSWYSTNIGNKTEYDNKVASGGSAGFCNDREMASGYTWSSEPSSTIHYAAYERIFNNRTPSYECSNTNDMYTTKIGLITADEVMYAGAAGTTSNYGYYLYTGNYYWTMSPYHFYSPNSHAYVFRVHSYGYLGNSNVSWTAGGVRPVINLKSSVQITGGDGTADNPYIVQTD